MWPSAPKRSTESDTILHELTKACGLALVFWWSQAPRVFQNLPILSVCNPRNSDPSVLDRALMAVQQHVIE